MRRRRIEISMFVLGWFLALGFLAQLAFTRSSSLTYTHVASLLQTLGRSISAAEGQAAHRVRGGERADLIAKAYPGLRDVATLRKPPFFLWGAYDGGFPESMQGFSDLESRVGTFPLVALYQAWGDRPEHQFPGGFLSAIDRMGSVPVVTWEPWVTTFDSELWPQLPPRDGRDIAALAAIARGDYDFHIVRWAQAAASYGKPLFLRFAHEMNDPYRYPWGPQNGNRAEDFIKAWRHVHLLFQKKGATNVLWVFSPHPSMPWFEYYYPGDEYVDWIGMGALNYGNVASWSRWWPFGDILSRAYPVLSSFGKPVMITELGSVKTGGDPEQWWADARRSLAERFPAVRGAILFNQTHDDTLGGAAINWSPVNCSGCMTTLDSWVKEIRK